MKIKMKLGMILVIMDTLFSSASIKDGGQVFGYNSDARMAAFRYLESAIKDIDFTLESEE